ncbi:MAG TPA: M48 family metalloprotease [Acidobacteriaceae bacterium]
MRPRLLFLTLLLLAPFAHTQSAPDRTASCGIEQPSYLTKAPNIFNDQQEQYLGDAFVELTEPGLRLLPSAPGDQLTRIGEKLLAAIPPTGVHYTFRVYDSGEINAFSLAGGRVYISRKLLAAVKTEDDLAGVLAHEIGHIYTHQSAIETTRMLRVRLGVTQVTDRADIFAKIHQLYSTPPKQGESISSEEKDQLIADRVAIYAMIRAGYSPTSFASFLNTTTLNKSRTGNWFTDFTGQTGENSRRYRTSLALIAKLPAGCATQQPAAREAFAAWRRTLVEERVKSETAALAGDQPVHLDPPLRPSPWHIRFSPDGAHILVQDDASIYLVDRATRKMLFRIDAPDAFAAQFTPDSHGLVFHDEKLRVEQWNIDSGKRASVKELLVYDGCSQSLLSADGRTLVCASLTIHDDAPRVGLRLIDVESGKPIYEKPKFVDPSVMVQPSQTLSLLLEAINGSNVATIITSPDGKCLIVAALNQVLAYDLERRQPVTLSGKLRDLEQTRMSFIGSDKLFVVGSVNGKGLYETQLLSFPDGKLLHQAVIGDQQIHAVTKGSYLILSPLKDYAAAAFDPMTSVFTATSKFSAIDVYDNAYVTEDPTGGLQIGTIGSTHFDSVPLPIGPLPSLRASDLSTDGKYLAISTRDRAELWALQDGKKIGLIRPFRSAWFDDGDQLLGQFPKFLDKDALDYQMRMAPLTATQLSKLDTEEWQYRNLEVHFKPLGRGKAVNHHASLEVRKMGATAPAWSRDYQHETPACWPAEGNSLLLAWDLNTTGFHDELKNFPQLEPELAALKDKKKGILLEVVNAETGVPEAQVIVPEADLTGGHNDERRARVSGGYVLARGEHDNTVIYRLKDDSRVGEFFGVPLASNAATGLIAATNRDDEIILCKEQSGQEIARFTFGSPVRLARLLPENVPGSGSLLVLTADQVLHKLPIPAQP